MYKWIRLSADFSAANSQAKRYWYNQLKALKGKKKKEYLYNQNTLCGKLTIQNLSRDKEFPRVFLGGAVVKNLPANSGDTVLISDLERSQSAATESACHDYWACALQPGSPDHWAHRPQLLEPACPEAHALHQEKPGNEKLVHPN